MRCVANKEVLSPPITGCRCHITALRPSRLKWLRATRKVQIQHRFVLDRCRAKAKAEQGKSDRPGVSTAFRPSITGRRTGVGVIFGRGEFHADGFGWQPVATFLIRMPVDFPAYGRWREAVFRLCWCLVWWATSWLRVGVWRWRAR